MIFQLVLKIRNPSNINKSGRGLQTLEFNKLSISKELKNFVFSISTELVEKRILCYYISCK